MAGPSSVPFSGGRTVRLVSNGFTKRWIGVHFHQSSDRHRAVGTVLSYVFYWLVVIVVLVYLKFKEVGYLTVSIILELLIYTLVV